MERNIDIKREKCSTRRMRVTDDEGYDNRCDESTSQDLGINVTSHVRRTSEQRREEKHTKATIERSKHPSLLTNTR